jgi:tetratricopeptide (TPR) repeat protein
VSTSRRDDTLDPDALAALEEERDFLLASLRDLDRERAAGDVDDDDYQTLRDDYTHRAALVLTAIDQRTAARAAATAPRNRTRTLLGVAGVLLFAVLAGFGVARAAGLRTSTDGLTGDVRPTVGQALFRCQELVMANEIRDALECYDQIIEEHPANVEAMTYRAWALAMFAGLPEYGWPYLEQAVAIDPAYSDARAFRAIILNWWCRPEEAIAEIDAFDASNPLAEMTALVEGNGLRQRAEELIDVRQQTPSVAGAPTPISEVGIEDWDQCPVLADAGVLERIDPEAPDDEAEPQG